MAENYLVTVTRRKPITDETELAAGALNDTATHVEATTEKQARAAVSDVFDLDTWKITDVQEAITSYPPGTGPAPADDAALEEIEAHHGFLFGAAAEKAAKAATPSGHVTCSNPDCDRVNVMTSYHADTELPIHCGGCGTVLLCDHDWQPVEDLAGTLGAPVKVTWEHCTICGTDRNRVETPITPIDLADVPLGQVAAILNTPAATIPQYSEQVTH